MCDRRKQTWAAVFIGNVLIHTVAIASPIYVPQFQPGSTGRNIRHLPCVSRRSGETGVCMFAFTCAKANGTHLGTCIDRFYFGSCCKIDDEPDIFPQDNSIDDGPPPPRPFITTHGPSGSSGIPEYFARPKPTDAKKPAEASQITTTPIFLSTQSTQTSANTMKDATKFITKKPTITTIEMTTQTTRLSTFQTVQSTGPSTEATSLKKTNSTVNMPSSISSSTTGQPTKPSTLASTLRPNGGNITKLTSTTTVSKPTTKKPVVSTTTVQRPTAQVSQKPLSSTTRKPILQSTTTTIKNVLATTTQKIAPSTRFPPRNTTSVKPLTQAITRKPSTKRPSTTVITKRPVVTTKKPTTLTKRPSTPSKLPTNSSFGTTLPVTTKPHSTSSLFSSVGSSSANVTESTLASTGIKPLTTTTSATSEKTTTTTKNTDQKTTTTKTTTPKTTSKTTTKSSTIRTTTARPTTVKTTTGSRTTTSRPSSSATTKLKPTKITSTTTKTTKPEYISTTTTERTRPLSSTVGSTIGITKPRPSTTKPTSLMKVPVNTSSIVEVTTSISSSISTFIVKNESTSTHVPPTKDQNVNHTLEEIPLTTYSPGLVTWSSNSDEVSTKASETSSSTSTITTSSEQAETDWSPITTPDGWIMIQSPTTENLPQTQESTTEPVAESTIQSLTSAKPITESTIMANATKRPMVPSTTLPSTIHGVTIDTELPVPMETLNMSDYKQVCGRRLFPEPKIVGGDRSSFGKWPWQISLRQWRSQTYLHKCGAALLNENWAITAAHCVESVPPSDLLLRIGEHDLANEDEPYGYQERRVQIVASHPQFDARTFEYDLALLRFYEPLLPFQPNVLPICLPDDDETYVGRTAYVTGWGRLYDEGPLPSVLQEVAVPVINNSVCEAMYRNAGYIEHIPHIFICAGWRNGGFDSCEGDSGGPMVIQRARDKRWILAGIISWGIGCAAPNQPGVYTRISEFREWINQILQF
ncbi:serine proteinase stubble [Pogonomyrmex barbatus]|uniref:Serine proteinase stubble n=1 Tax=Pogonomyrmex barbatus TaxID=144034 RepID=A0A6I9W3R8_9HYME|nr:serine proteinase stubble [Pogonomyrmex barbatus]